MSKTPAICFRSFFGLARNTRFFGCFGSTGTKPKLERGCQRHAILISRASELMRDLRRAAVGLDARCICEINSQAVVVTNANIPVDAGMILCAVVAT